MDINQLSDKEKLVVEAQVFDFESLSTPSIIIVENGILKSKKMLFVNYIFYIVQFVNALFSWISTQWLLTTIVSITFSTVEIIAFILFVVEIVKYSFAKQSTTNVLNN